MYPLLQCGRILLSNCRAAVTLLSDFGRLTDGNAIPDANGEHYGKVLVSYD